nr:DUF4956 domain-containing protein [Clostridiales bacterium]
MLSSVISSIFSSSTSPITVTIGEYLICLLVALGLGVVTSLVGRFRSKQSKSLSVALVLLPMIVQTIIMLVNKEFGAGLAVAGAFSLLRFRSAPASARDIILIALAVAIGLALGMGCVGIAVIITVLVLAVLMVLSMFGFGKPNDSDRILRIVIPESLNYDDVFEDIFRKYTSSCELVRVKTTNMGSLYKLKYEITFKDVTREKQFIDELRVRNGNLEISCTK